MRVRGLARAESRSERRWRGVDRRRRRISGGDGGQVRGEEDVPVTAGAGPLTSRHSVLQHIGQEAGFQVNINYRDVSVSSVLLYQGDKSVSM